MSGGSYDYFYSRIEEFACAVDENAHGDPLRLAFAAHLRLVAKAAHDLEWRDSCDYGEGGEVAAIRAVLHTGAEVEAAVAQARRALEQLNTAIARAEER